MQLDPTTITVILAAVTVTLDRAVALAKAIRDRANPAQSCSNAHDNMCKVIDRLATLQEKEIEILHSLSTSAEITKLMLNDNVGDRRARSYSPRTVDLIRDLLEEKNKLSFAKNQMSDPPPDTERKKRGEKT
jgi:hypothetical protein